MAAVAAMLALPLLVSLYLAFDTRSEALEEYRRQTLAVARTVATTEGQALSRVREQMQQMAGLAGMDASFSGMHPCASTLRQLLHVQPEFRNIAFADMDGNVVCAAHPARGTLNIADRPYFRTALEERAYVLSEPLVSRQTGDWTVAAAHPVSGTGQSVRGVLLAALDLRWAQTLLDSVRLPPGSIVSISDAEGTILARTPDGARHVGKKILESAEFARTVRLRTEGISHSAGLDDVARIIAFTQVPGSRLFVRVGVPESAVATAGHRSFLAAMSGLTVVTLLTALLIWRGSRRLVVEPVRRLVEAASRLDTGDLSARTGVPHEQPVIGKLARKFDELAAHSQRTTRALRTLSAGNRTLLRESSEPALLDAMCRVAVEKGGYPLAMVNYANADEARSVTTRAHAGTNHGFIEGLNLTWADTERGRGTVGPAIRDGRPCILRSTLDDPRFRLWRDSAAAHGFRSVISLPLQVDGEVIGTFTLLAGEEDAFDADEVALLDEMAADMSFGIGVIRARARAAEVELIAARALTHDRTTELPNRGAFLLHVEKEIAARAGSGEPTALMVVYLPRLQSIYDAFGYQSSVRLLREVAARLSRTSPGGGIARLQTDEFGVLLPGHDAAAAGDFALRLQALFQEPLSLGELEVDVPVAVGASFHPGHGDAPEILVRRASIAAREGARRELPYHVYQGSHDSENPARLALATELRTAIGQKALRLVYQPKIEIATGRVASSEALLRWPHATRGMVSPGEFVPLAEETGLIRPMTLNVLDMAVRQQFQWGRNGRTLPVAVNLSARNLYDPRLIDSFLALLDTWGVAAEQIEFEITEGALVHDPATARDVLVHIRSRGSKIYIDDFGTGYSSLNYLVSLPVHALKIDRSFVTQMPSSREARSVVASVISMAHELGLEVVAEGVETKEELEMLRDLRCDQAQGYYFHKPLPAAEYGKLVA